MFSLLRNHQTVLHSSCGNFTFPLAMHEGFWSSTYSTLVIFSLFNYSHPCVCEMASHYGFDLHSQMTNDVQHPFMHVLVICMSFLEKQLSSLSMLKMELSFDIFSSFTTPCPLLPTLGIDPRAPTQQVSTLPLNYTPAPHFIFLLTIFIGIQKLFRIIIFMGTSFETGSMQSKVVFNSHFFYFYLPSAEITDMCRHIWFIVNFVYMHPYCTY